MMENNEGGGEKKKYHIIDKRRGDTEAPAEKEQPAESEPESAESTPPQQPESAAPQQPPAQEEARKGPGIEEAFVLVLNLLREQALSGLGMVLPPTKSFKPDTKQAELSAEIFHSLATKFSDMLKPLLSEQQENVPPESDIVSTIVLTLNIIQSQIIVHMGLIADPATNLIVKDMPQARKGIDIFAALMEVAGTHLPADIVRQFDGILSDMRLNYVNQLKRP